MSEPAHEKLSYAHGIGDTELLGDTIGRNLDRAVAAHGDRVGIWAVNCPEWVLVQYATARIGAVMVTINPAYRAHEVEFVLNQAGISLLVASLSHRTSDYRALVDQVRADCPDLRAVHYIGDPSWDELTAAAPAVTRRSWSTSASARRGRRSRQPRR